MGNRLGLKPLGLVARTADCAMSPIMRLVSGAPTEAPQRTHLWNYVRLNEGELKYLDETKMVSCQGITVRIQLWRRLHHLTIFGGWKPYVVIRPRNTEEKWHIGWRAGNVHGVSRIVLRGPVRMLIGPGDVWFFGVRELTDEQIQIMKIGFGEIGDGGPHSQTPLL